MLSPSRLQDKLFYGWVLLAAFLAIGIVLYGSYNSFGVFFKSIESEFGLTRAATSAIFSAYMGLACVSSIIGGWALDRYGPRIVTLVMGLFTGLSLLLTGLTNELWQLFLTYSLLLSLGAGAIYVVTMATVSRWFDKKRGLALGIAGSASALGMFIIAPFATYLISSFSWRTAYIVIGLIVWLVAIPLSRLLRKDPYEIRAQPDGVNSYSGQNSSEYRKGEGITQSAGFSLMEASKTGNFWFVGFIWLMYGFCFFLVLTHIIPHATDMGIPAMQAASILSLIGGSNIAGRLLMGKVSDSIGRKVTAIACALLVAGAMIWLMWAQDLWMLYLFGVVFGFSFGGFDPSIAALISEIFGLRSLGVIMGTLNIAWAVGAAIGPVVGGLAFDFNSSYSVAFIAGALAMLTAGLLIAPIRLEKTSLDK